MQTPSPQAVSQVSRTLVALPSLLHCTTSLPLQLSELGSQIWAVQAPLRHTLLVWRWVARAQHEERVLSSMADVHRERQLQQRTLFRRTAASEPRASARNAQRAVHAAPPLLGALRAPQQQ